MSKYPIFNVLPLTVLAALSPEVITAKITNMDAVEAVNFETAMM